MKHFILTIMMGLLSVTAVHAETLAVDKLIYRPNDLSASVFIERDLNGNPCGLLKVVSDDKSLTFEGSIVGAPEYKNGEYWVYIPAGTYIVKIKSSHSEPVSLNFRDYNLSQVEAKATYELTLRDSGISGHSSDAFLDNAYTALHEGQVARARRYYNEYQKKSGKSDTLFEEELSKFDGSYIWTEDELVAAGFEPSENLDDDFNNELRFAQIKTSKGTSCLIQDAYKNSTVINGTFTDGFVNGLTLLKNGNSYELAYVCKGRIMAPSIEVIRAPLLMEERNQDPNEDERNWLFINLTVHAPYYNFVTGDCSSDGIRELISYLKQIYTPYILNKDFLYELSLGRTDMDLIRKNFSKFMMSGTKIPAHLMADY